jgi:hypothetical protein
VDKGNISWGALMFMASLEAASAICKATAALAAACCASLCAFVHSSLATAALVLGVH